MIRGEEVDDIDAIDRVVTAAFGDREQEARLVSLIRQRRQSLVSLVAVDGDEVSGHVMVSPIDIGVTGKYGGLAPLSVAPDFQGTGIGSKLMEAAIAASRNIGIAALFVLGDPNYYRRFGFTPSHIENEYGATDAFMHLELVPGCLAGVEGTAKYVAAFREVDA